MFAAMVAVVLELLVVVVAAVNLGATVCGWQRVRVVTARSIVLLTAAAASWCVLHGWYRSAAVSAASCAAWCLYWGGPGRKRRGRRSQARVVDLGHRLVVEDRDGVAPAARAV